MVTICHVWMGLAEVQAPVWTAGGMGHWKRLIKIPGGTNGYYCINIMICLIHVYYVQLYSVLFLIFYPHHVTCIPCYTSWYLLHSMWWQIIHVHVCYVFHVFSISCILHIMYTRQTHCCSISTHYNKIIRHTLRLHIHIHHNNIRLQLLLG